MTPHMNPYIADLHEYPFERLSRLLDGIAPPADLEPITLTIGEPRHPPPPEVLAALTEHLDGLGRYPMSAGLPALRERIAEWATARFCLPAGALDPASMVLPVSGTREALFAFGQAVVTPGGKATVVMPNPFYQIYEGTTLMAGATPWYVSNHPETGLSDLAEVPASVWRDCQLLFICTPGNPNGAVMSIDDLAYAIELADRYDFVLASDECYSELYLDEASPPPGLLQACAELGRHDFARCVAFHSLSKRSNLPGLRSGFVAGDAHIVGPYRQYRTYHGCAAPLPVQEASVIAWGLESHVAENRAAYRRKFDAAIEILSPVLPVTRPAAGFYLFPDVGRSGEDFARELYAAKNIRVLPGSYLGRGAGDGSGENPADRRVRISLVATEQACREACHRIADFLA